MSPSRYALELTQSPTDAEVCLIISVDFYVENKNGYDVSDKYCLKLLKNC